MYTHNLLIAARKTCALDQREVAAMLGVSHYAVSNWELGQRTPGLVLALGLEVLYGKPVATLFPETVLSIAARVVEGAHELSIDIEGGTDPMSLRKQQFLRALAERLITIQGA